MTGHIFIEGEVGEKVTIESVRADIALYPEATEWEVHIDSPGGDVDTGYAIGSILNNLKHTTANIGALCASIATYCAHCCDKIIMGPAGDFMIHLPTGTVQGTATDLRKGAERLDRIKSELTTRYMKRVARKGVSASQVSSMLDEETSMSPSEALAMGFVDEVREKLKAVARFNTQFKNIEMETMSKDEAKGWFENIGKKLDEVMRKFRNAVTVTLADGSVINSDAPDVNSLVGSKLTDEAGAPLVAGTYETMDGIAIVVDETGTVVSAAPIVEDKGKDDNAAKIAALEAENATLKQQLADKEAGVKAQVEAQAKTTAEFKNALKEVQDELSKIKNTTFGDPNPPIDAPDKTIGKQTDPMVDAMANSLGSAFVTSRRF